MRPALAASASRIRATEASAASCMARGSLGSKAPVSGFSTIAWRPAASAAAATGSCAAGGAQTCTTSAASISASRSATAGTPCAAAKRSAFAAVGEWTPTMSTSVPCTRAMASMCSFAANPEPTMPARTVFLSRIASSPPR